LVTRVYRGHSGFRHTQTASDRRHSSSDRLELGRAWVCPSSALRVLVFETDFAVQHVTPYALAPWYCPHSNDGAKSSNGRNDLRGPSQLFCQFSYLAKCRSPKNATI